MEKHLFTIFESITSSLIENLLSKHALFNGTYFCELILSRLINVVFLNQTGQCKRRIILQIDNARSQIQRVSLVYRGHEVQRYIAYSPDITPSESYVCSIVKE